MKTSIEIRRLEVYARHGVLPQEQRVGQRFEVSLRLDYDFTEAARCDNLDGTVNYAEAAAIVAQVMQQPSQLLEHVCWRIREALLERWPAISGGRIEVLKPRPPFAAVCAGCAVSIEW